MMISSHKRFSFAIRRARDFANFRPRRFLDKNYVKLVLSSRGWCWRWESFCKCFVKKFWDSSQSYLRFTVLHRTNQLGSVFMDLSIFLLLLFPIESVSPEWTLVGISFVIPSAIQVLEWMRIQLPFLCLQLRRVNLFVGLATPPKFTVVFRLVGTVAFNTFRTLDFAWKGSVTPLPTVLVLWDTRVHIGSSNGHDIPSNIEASVN